MNTARPKRDLKTTRKYLQQVLSLNPTSDANLMSQMRLQYCGLKQTAPRRTADDPASTSKRREAINNQLESIRSQFWKLPGPRIRELLDAMHVRDFPELKAGVDRLKLLSMHRESIQQLSKHRKRETNLYNTFRRLVMLPPRQAGEIKERYLRAFAHSSARSKVFLMIKMMQKEYPELYALEADWFRQITKIKKRAAAPATDHDYDGDVGIPGWMIWVGLMILLRILLMMGKGIGQ